MADIIRYISSFSDDAVHNAIQQAVGAEKQCFIDILVRFSLSLKNRRKERKKNPECFDKRTKQYLSR